MKRVRFLRTVAGVMVLAVLLSGVVLSGVSCGGGSSEGEVPVYKVGDQWVWSAIFDGDTYDVTCEATEKSALDGEECYVIDWTFDPSLYEVFDSARMWVSTSEPYFSPLKMQMEATMLGESISMVMEGSAEYPNGDPWPLEVGKQFTLVETTTTTTVISGETETETETETTVHKVESKEDITVAAGKFTCFVIKEYNEEGELLTTCWYSDKVKNDVKSIDAVEGENTELKSYSFA